MLILWPRKISAPSFAALHFKAIVERSPARKTRHWYHEVAAGIADETIHLALVVALARTTIPIPDPIMRQQRTEPLSSLAFAMRHDLSKQTPVIGIEDRLRDRTKEREGMDVPIQPGLGVRSRIRADITGIAMRQVQRKEVGFVRHATNHNRCFSKVSLPMFRWMG